MIRIPTSKIPNFFVDVRQDLVYAYGLPSRIVRAIWRVKRAPKQAYASFRQFSCAMAHHFLGDLDSDVKNAKFFRESPSRPCLCIRLAITDCPALLEGQTSPKRAYASFRRFSCAIAHSFLGDPDSDVKNAKSFSWMSVKTLSMHTVVHHGLSGPFGGSYDPRSEHTPHFDDFRVL